MTPCQQKIYEIIGGFTVITTIIMFNQHANVQHIDLKVPLFGRGGISEDLKPVSITVR